MAMRFLAGIVFLAAATTLTSAQARKGAARNSAVSGRADAPVAMKTDPCFQSELQNSDVKIFRVRVAAQASTEFDIHAHDYLVLSLGNSAFKVKSEFNSRSVQMSAGELQVFKGGWPQRLVNTTDDPLDLVELEMAKGIEPEHAECGLSAAECRDGEFGEGFTSSTLFETPKIKLGRVDLGPNGVLPRHSHIQSHVLVALADMKLSDQETGKDPKSLQLKTGEVDWHEGPEEHTLTNVGDKDASIIVVEFKE